MIDLADLLASRGFTGWTLTGTTLDGLFWDETVAGRPKPTQADIDGWSLEYERLRARRRLAAKRFSVETGGMTVSGAAVSTDRDSQGLVTGAAFAASLDSEYTVQWKTAAGFIFLDATAIIALAQAVRAHVQAAFDREAQLTALIEAAETVAEVRAINIETGWSA